MKDLERGRLVRTHKQRAIRISDADEIRAMLSLYDNGEAAFAMMMLWRAEHGARCRAGDTFIICIKAMVEAQTMGTWGARKYRLARDICLHARLIELVSEARGTRAAEYRLTDRVLTSSVAERARKVREFERAAA
jgi:hypothetical protein